MDEVDKQSKELKSREGETKQEDIKLHEQINSLKTELEKINKELSEKDASRNEFAKSVPEALLSKYTYIREGRQGLAVVPIDGENCGGCSITLRPQIINDVIKAQELIICDSCSRILYKKSEE